MTALDVIRPYEVLRGIPDADIRRPNDRMVRHGKIWTCAGVSAGIDLALALTAELTDEQTARAIQLGIEYDPQPPFDSGHMSKASPEVRARAERDMRAAATSVREAAALPVVFVRRFLDVIRSKVRRNDSPRPLKSLQRRQQ